MNYLFEIQYKDHGSIANLSFTINKQLYSFCLKVYMPDCDQFHNKINSYYFSYETINEYGAKNRQIEYVNCFEELALKIDNPNISLFGIKLKKEFEITDKEILKSFLLEINKNIIYQIKKHFHLDIDTKEFNNNDDNDFEEEEYYVGDEECEGSELQYMFFPTLQQLFKKYECHYMINDKKPKPINILVDDELKYYSIESRGDAIGNVIINNKPITEIEIYEEPNILEFGPSHNNNDMIRWDGDMECYPIEQLLQLKVNLSSWNNYRWCEKEYEERDIVKIIFERLIFCRMIKKIDFI